LLACFLAFFLHFSTFPSFFPPTSFYSFILICLIHSLTHSLILYAFT
jgi:hypothetical protein